MPRIAPSATSKGKWYFSCQACGCCHGFFTEEYLQVDPEHPSNAIWRFNGDMERPTIEGSVRTYDNEGTICHSYITDGMIQYLDDCRHELAGKLVELPGM